jgi:hypothetical protein
MVVVRCHSDSDSNSNLDFDLDLDLDSDSDSDSDSDLKGLMQHNNAIHERFQQNPPSTADLRCSLKTLRDPSKTAFDLLPSGETIGSFANRCAVERYTRKIESKRERARETRRRKRKRGILYLPSKKH